jgi:hypothetical protein
LFKLERVHKRAHLPVPRHVMHIGRVTASAAQYYHNAWRVVWRGTAARKLYSHTLAAPVSHVPQCPPFIMIVPQCLARLVV